MVDEESRVAPRQNGWPAVKHARYYWLLLAESHLTQFGTDPRRPFELLVIVRGHQPRRMNEINDCVSRDIRRSCCSDGGLGTEHNRPPASTDVYHLHFAKAAPGQAAALAKSLMTPDKTSTMPEHFIVLRHQEGDDWDYVVIQHLGSKAEVTATALAPSDAVRALTAWHNDTFVSGPSWGVFSKEMSIGGSADSASLVYIVGVHRAVPGHREQLLTSLNAAGPSNKIQTGDVLLQHLEGSEWTFATITRYNSWQDLATERAAAATAGGWADIRQHSAFHRDTIVNRIQPAK